MSIKVLVVDDQALVRTGFKMILEAEPGIDVVGEAVDGLEAVAMARELAPDVVLMDIRMPNLDGVEATRQIAGPDAPEGGPRVLILTTFDLDEYVYDALRAGASGFLLKDTPAEDLARAVHVIAGGDSLLAPSVTTRLVRELATKPVNDAPPPPEIGVLTDRETEVLTLMARGRSNAEIAADLFVSETTVKTHVGRVLMKLHLRDRVQAVVLAYETGLVKPGA
jgi:DNA-binding NarL/FixJ family response regulator